MKRAIKQANGLFLSIILLYLGIVVLLSFLASRGIFAGNVFTLLLGEALIGVPALLMLVWHRSEWKEWKEWIPLCKIKVSTVLLLIVFAYLVMPLAMLANALSLFFVENQMVNSMSGMTDVPMVLLVFITGIYGPVCEEIAFRGVIFCRYRRTGRILGAVLLSALLFGLMHLNGNQLGYAAILGFVFAMLVEATGSIWAPFIVHAVINTHNTIMLMMSESFLKLAGTPEALSELSYTKTELAMTVAVLLPIAAFMTVLAVGGFILIARNEGRLNHVKAIFAKRNPDQPKVNFVTWSLVVAVLLCIFVIFVLPFKR